MKYIRFEIHKHNQPMNIGIMKGLLEIDVPFEEEKELLFDFNRWLPIPEVSFVENPFAISFFTEEGNEFFERSIERLTAFIENFENKIYSVEKIEIDSSDPNVEVIYEDEYQLLVNIH